MSTSLNRAAELAALTPPPSIGRTQQFLSEVSGPTQDFAQGIVQSRAPMPTVGLQSQAFSDQLSNPVSRMLPSSSPALANPYASRRAEIQEFTKWLDRREALRQATDSEPAEQTVRASAQQLSEGTVVKPNVHPVRVQASEPIQPATQAASSETPSAAGPEESQTPSTPSEPAPAAKEAPPEHWLDRAAPIALRRIWTTNLALGSYILGGLGTGQAASPLAAGIGTARSMIGGGSGDFELLNHLRFVRSTLERLPVAPEHVPAQAAAAFHQAVPTHQLLQTLAAGASDRQALINQLAQYGPNMIGLVRDSDLAGGLTSKGFEGGFPSGGGPDSGYIPAGSGGPMPGVADSSYVPSSPGGSMPSGLGGVSPSAGPAFAGPAFAGSPIAGMPSFRSLMPAGGQGVGGASGGPLGGIPPEMTGAQYGQATLASPLAHVASPDLAAGGSAVSFSPADLIGGSSPVDASGLSSLRESIPGAQMIYPAISGAALPPGATNVPLASSLVQQMHPLSASGALSPSLAESIASRGAAAGPGAKAGGGAGAGGAGGFQLVPSGRPAPGATSLFGPAGAKALDHAGGGQASRGGPLDFMGVPVRLAPSLGGKSSLASEKAVHQAVNKSAGGTPMRPEQFQLLRSKLFPSTTSASVEPNSSAWQQAAAAHGLRSASPEALMAPDARLKPLSATDPIPQVEGGRANLKDLGLSPEIGRMPPLTPSRVSAVNRAIGGLPGTLTGHPGGGPAPIGHPAQPMIPQPPLLGRIAPGGGPPLPGTPHPLGARAPEGGTGPAGASMSTPAAGSASNLGRKGLGPLRMSPGPDAAANAGSAPLGWGRQVAPHSVPRNLGIRPPSGASLGQPLTTPPATTSSFLPGPKKLDDRRPLRPITQPPSRTPSGPMPLGHPASSAAAHGTGAPWDRVQNASTQMELPHPPTLSAGPAHAPGPIHGPIEPKIGAPAGPQGLNGVSSLGGTLHDGRSPLLEHKLPGAVGPMDHHRAPLLKKPTLHLPDLPGAHAHGAGHGLSPYDFPAPRDAKVPPIDLEFKTPAASAARTGLPTPPGTSRTFHHTGPSRPPEHRPEMTFPSPPPKSSGPSSSKMILQKSPTSESAVAASSGTATKTSSSTTSKKSGVNDVDLLANEVWSILQRRLAFEALRAGRR